LSSVVFDDPLTPGILASLGLIVLSLSLTMRRGR
jgi:hypothetical protein